MLGEDRKRCSRCVLPSSEPDVSLDDAGVCSVCRACEGRQGAGGGLLETEFVKLLDKHRGKGKYECLVMCSGGKDSTAALYYMKRRYKMAPLAFTFDHGFEVPEALANVRSAVSALGVDFLYFKTDFLRKMFARMIQTQSRAVMCHPCSIWYMQLTFDLAARFKIPLIIAGWTKGQAARKGSTAGYAYSAGAPEYASMAKATADFLAGLREDPDYKDFPTSMEEVVARARKKHKAIVLSPHWFLDQTAADYVRIIKAECGWKQPPRSYPAGSTNCAMNDLSVYFSLKHYGYTHYHVEMSKLIRQGLMTRQEALDRLKVNFDAEQLKEVAARCGCRLEAEL